MRSEPCRTGPGGPELLIGGMAAAVVRRRVARWGNGFTSGGSPPAPSAEVYRAVEEGWKAAGRPGKPRFVGGFYFGLGPNAAQKVGAYLRDYYGFMGAGVEAWIGAVPKTPKAVWQAIQTWQDVGADETVAYPCIAELGQMDRLLEVMRTVP